MLLVPLPTGFQVSLISAHVMLQIPSPLVTYIWDIRDLENPKQTGLFKSPQYGIDHNQYIANGKAYQSHYGAGLRILDVSSIPSDPTGKGVKEVAFFDGVLVSQLYPES